MREIQRERFRERKRKNSERERETQRERERESERERVREREIASESVSERERVGGGGGRRAACVACTPCARQSFGGRGRPVDAGLLPGRDPRLAPRPAPGWLPFADSARRRAVSPPPNSPQPPATAAPQLSPLARPRGARNGPAGFRGFRGPQLSLLGARPPSRRAQRAGGGGLADRRGVSGRGPISLFNEGAGVELGACARHSWVASLGGGGGGRGRPGFRSAERQSQAGSAATLRRTRRTGSRRRRRRRRNRRESGLGPGRRAWRRSSGGSPPRSL